MRIFKNRSFHRWAYSENLTDEILKKAVREMETGLYEASLRSGLYKKRIARQERGKREGYRILLAFKEGEKTFFIYGFAKNDRGDISESERKIHRQLAKNFLSMDASAIQKMLNNGKLFEVT